MRTEAFEWKEAEGELRQALALNPRNPEVLFRLGFMLFTSGRVHEALAQFEQAKALDPFYSTVVSTMHGPWRRWAATAKPWSRRAAASSSTRTTKP